MSCAFSGASGGQGGRSLGDEVGVVAALSKREPSDFQADASLLVVGCVQGRFPLYFYEPCEVGRDGIQAGMEPPPPSLGRCPWERTVRTYPSPPWFVNFTTQGGVVWLGGGGASIDRSLSRIDDRARVRASISSLSVLFWTCRLRSRAWEGSMVGPTLRNTDEGDAGVRKHAAWSPYVARSCRTGKPRRNARNGRRGGSEDGRVRRG
eukprot:scaffold574_cov333-Pavlova_lutheri.AAC.8